MTTRASLLSESGITLVETLIAMLVLSVGAMGMAATFLHGMKTASSSPAELMATQKAAEAIESVFSARDSHTVTWDELRNAADDGIFLDGPQPLKTGGDDGIVNTGDDGEAIEAVELPGPDQNLASQGDNRVITYGAFKREIVIEDISEVLRSLTVVITYPSGGVMQTYSLTTYISAFA